MNLLQKVNRYHIIIVVLAILILVLLVSKYRSIPSSIGSVETKQEQQQEQHNVLPNMPEHFTKKSLPAAELTLFYATWCGYSRQFLPEWEKFEGYAKANFPTLKVTSVRCENGNEAQCSQKGVEGYPTVIFYKGDAEVTFTKGRTSDNLIQFVKENM